MGLPVQKCPSQTKHLYQFLWNLPEGSIEIVEHYEGYFIDRQYKEVEFISWLINETSIELPQERLLYLKLC